LKLYVCFNFRRIPPCVVDKYRIMSVLKVEIDIITSIAGQNVILLIMYVETFKTDFNVFISNITLTDNFQYLE
jgi:hypothetical protein